MSQISPSWALPTEACHEEGVQLIEDRLRLSMSIKKRDTKIRAGVVGVGYLGQFHAAKYAQSQQADLVAVVDIRPERARFIAQKYKSRDFTHHSEIFHMVDAVSIAAPTHSHYEIAGDFLDHGIDVLVEKPITVTVQQADDLIMRASKNNCILQVGHLERFNPVVRDIRGLLNFPLFFESHRLSPFKARSTDVDVVLDLMIHDIDIILNFVCSDVVSIDAIGIPVLTPFIDIANVRVRFASGCMANLTASRISDKELRKTRIFQPDAYISIDYATREVLIYRKSTELSPDGVPRIVADQRHIQRTDALREEIEAFLHCVATRTPPEVSGHDGRQALGLATRIIESIQESIAWVEKARSKLSQSAQKTFSGTQIL